MQELKWWVVILFMLVIFDRVASLMSRFERWADARGNGSAAPVTLGKLRETLGLLPSSNKTFSTLIEETYKERFEQLIGSINALTQINGRLLEQTKDLVALERARIEVRQQGE